MKGSSSTPALGLGRLGPAEFAPAHPPKKDFMRQNRDRVELQSSLAAAKRSVRDPKVDLGGTEMQARCGGRCRRGDSETQARRM